MESKAQFKPLLPQLQSLDSDYEDLKTRFQFAAILAKLPDSPLDFRNGAKNGHGTKPQTKSVGHARAEWVLRWLLEKLKSDSTGRAVRSLPATWELFTKLVRAIPPSSVTRTLEGGILLRLLDKALDEQLSLLEASEAISATKDTSADDLDTNSMRKTRKRKRLQKDYSQVPASKRPIVTGSSLQDLCLAVQLFLEGLITRAASGDAISREHIESTLRTDADQAAKLFGSWIRLIQAIGISKALEQLSLSPFLHIWTLRCIAADDEMGASMAAFSSNCFKHTAVLYQILTDTGSADEEDGLQKSFKVKEMVRQLESLITKHILIPARAGFLAPQQRKNTSKNLQIDNLASALSPLRNSTPVVLEFIPKLLELAIRNSPRSTPNNKVTEISWIEAVIYTLAASVGETLSEDVPLVDVITPDTAESTLEKMLYIVEKWKIPLNPELFQATIIRQSHLIETEDSKINRKIRWGLIARVLSLDGDVFLHGTGTKISGSLSTTKSFTGPLVQAISAMRWTIGSSGQPEDRGIQSETKADLYYDDRDIFVDKVVIPLMHVYAYDWDLPGFLEVWFTELKKLSSEIQSGRNHERIAWTSDKLVKAISNQLDSSLNTAQIIEALDTYMQPLSALSNEVEKTAPKDKDDFGVVKYETLHSSVEFSAALVVLEAILSGMSRDDTLVQTKLVLRSIFKLLKDLSISGQLSLPVEGRIWRLLGAIRSLQHQVEDMEDFLSQGVEILESNLLDKASKSAMPSVGEYPITTLDPSYQPYIFVLDTCSPLIDVPELKDRITDIIQSLASAMTGEQISQIFENLDQKNHQGMEEKNIGLHLAGFTKYPRAISLLQSDQRQEIFQTILCNASLEAASLEICENMPAEGKNILHMEFLQESILTLADPRVRADYLTIVNRALDFISKPNKSKPQSFLLKVTHHLLLRFPPEAIRREDREAILNTLAGFTSFELPDDEGQAQILSLMARLLDYPSPNSKLCSEPETIWAISQLYDSHNGRTKVDRSKLLLLGEVAMTVFRQIISELHLERNKNYLNKFANNNSKLMELEKDGSFTGFLGSLMLLRAWQSTFDSVADKIELDQRLSVRCAKILELDLRSLEVAGKNSNSDVELLRWAIFGACGLFHGVGNIDLVNPLAQLTRAWVASETQFTRSDLERDVKNTKLGKLQLSAYCRAIEHLGSVSSSLNEVSTLAADLLGRSLFPEDYAFVVECFRQFIKSEGPITKLSMLQLLDLLEAEENLKVGVVPLRNVFIEELEPIRGNDDEALNTELKAILPKLCAGLQTNRDIRLFHSIIRCINTILRSKHWMVSQFGIDSLIAALTTLASSNAPGLPQAHGPSVYSSICQTLNILLLLHRKHVGGRFHLLIPLLQSLLTSLFVLHGHKNPLPSQTPPPWLATQTYPLTGYHATAYTRVLLCLTQPTVSSASNQYGRKAINSFLVDETRKARQYAGQFVHYVLMHYCNLQLAGRLNGQVRRALLPGIWACIEVVPRHVLRAMNAGMGPDERSIWGAVWAEWNRVH